MAYSRIFVRISLLLVILMCLAAPSPAQPLFPGATGNALIDSLRLHFKPSVVADYNTARDFMYGVLYYENGSIECFFTGNVIAVMQANARIQAQDAGYNTEHLWPQSKFLGRGNAYSDLHHLRPVRADVNQSRSNYRFAFLEPSEVTHYWKGKIMQTTNPGGDLGTWSLVKDLNNFDISFFEPRDAVKGDVARALFYFYTMYEEQALGSDRNFFATQMADLFEFHELDPADFDERTRTMLIASLQSGKENPFILDSTLVRRAYFTNYDGPVLPPIEDGTFQAEYSFSGTADCNEEDLEPNQQSKGLTLTAFFRVGVNCNVVSNALNSNGWTESYSSNRYVGFAGSAGTEFELGFSEKDTLSMFIRRSGSGPSLYRILLIADGDSQVIREGSITAGNTSNELSIGMPEIGRLTDFEIRIHAWSATSSGGTFRISSLKLSGQVDTTTMGTGIDEDDQPSQPDQPGA